MGRRSWQLRCNDCSRMAFWKYFDHLSKDEIIEFAETTSCPNCGGDDWFFSETTRFAGASASGGRYIKLHCECDSCDVPYGGFYVKVSMAGPEELKQIAKNAECPDCGGTRWKYGDGAAFKLNSSYKVEGSY